ncbi:MAG: hypothetical protein ACLQF0_05490 [Dissulfurispiraceae bacterium]
MLNYDKAMRLLNGGQRINHFFGDSETFVALTKKAGFILFEAADLTKGTATVGHLFPGNRARSKNVPVDSLIA